MNNIKLRQYYKTDRDIYDQLVQKSPSKPSILEHLKFRGLLFSNQEDKQELAERISPWFTSFFDQKCIVDDLGGNGSQRKHNYSEVLVDFDIEEIKNILIDTKSEFDFTTKQLNNSLEITHSYTKSDFTKNALSQNIQKTGEIKIEKTADNKILIRTNSDEKANQIVEVIKQKIKEKHEDAYDDFEIDLSTIIDPETRTKFLLDTVQHIEDYEIIDMKSASINMTNKPNSLEEADEEVVSFIKKIVLNGGAVHQSNELANLLKKGFYLTKVEWTMVHKLASGDKIDLYAEFEDPVNCTGFKYALQRVYPSKGNGEYNVTGKPPSEIERSTILPKLEKSAKQSYIAILEEVANNNSSNNTPSEDEND